MTLETYLEEHGADTYEEYETEEEMVQIFDVYFDDGTNKTVAVIAEDFFDGYMILQKMEIYDIEWNDEITLEQAESLGFEVI